MFPHPMYLPLLHSSLTAFLQNMHYTDRITKQSMLICIRKCCVWKLYVCSKTYWNIFIFYFFIL